MIKMRWLLVTFVLLVAMTSYLGSYAIASEPVSAARKDSVYSNESFSITIPKGWEGNDSLWSGPVSSFHEMDIYNKFDKGSWVSIVRSSTKPFNCESPKQAAELSTALKELPPDEVQIPFDMRSVIPAICGHSFFKYFYGCKVNVLIRHLGQ